MNWAAGEGETLVHIVGWREGTSLCGSTVTPVCTNRARLIECDSHRQAQRVLNTPAHGGDHDARRWAQIALQMPRRVDRHSKWHDSV